MIKMRKIELRINDSIDISDNDYAEIIQHEKPKLLKQMQEYWNLNCKDLKNYNINISSELSVLYDQKSKELVISLFKSNMPWNSEAQRLLTRFYLNQYLNKIINIKNIIKKYKYNLFENQENIEVGLFNNLHKYIDFIGEDIEEEFKEIHHNLLVDNYNELNIDLDENLFENERIMLKKNINKIFIYNQNINDYYYIQSKYFDYIHGIIERYKKRPYESSIVKFPSKLAEVKMEGAEKRERCIILDIFKEYEKYFKKIMCVYFNIPLNDDINFITRENEILYGKLINDEEFTIEKDINKIMNSIINDYRKIEYKRKLYEYEKEERDEEN